MAVKIRLRRMGSNRKPFYRIVVTDSRRPMQGRFIENVGWYDPKKKHGDYELDVERVKYWADKGAVLSDTVRTLLKRAGKKTEKKAPAPAPAAPAVAEEEPASADA